MRIAFDFDFTLRFPSGKPVGRMVRLFKRFQRNRHELFIVTSRHTSKQALSEIKSFCDANDLHPIEIHFTDGCDKVWMLKHLNASVLFDDDDHEIAMCLNGGIKAFSSWTAEHNAEWDKLQGCF